jgi:hypothetical protein
MDVTRAGAVFLLSSGGTGVSWVKVTFGENN